MQLPMILKNPKNQKLKKTHKIEIFIRLWGMWNWKEGVWLKKIDCVHIFMRIYFNTEISIGETKVMKSCKVNTLVNTNHCLQNLKKRYRFSLAIVVPQSGSHSHSGDRLFECPKLSKKKQSITNESTYGEIYNSTYTQTYVLRCTQNIS